MKRSKLTLEIPTRLAYGVACVLAGGLLFSAAGALADGLTSTQSVLGSDLIMPYDGYLMVDSAPLTGTRAIKFDLYQDATGGTSVWSETQTVNLYNGRFSVGLGSSSSLTSTILDAEKLYLAMTIVETDSQGNAVEVELSGRQAIEPAPFAAWAANSADFNVAGDLTIEGDVITLGANSKTAISRNVNDQLYISPSKGFSGGVYVGNDFYTNYDTRLGPTDGSGATTIYGPESDGVSTAALQIKSSNGATMFIDNNEIDSEGTLALQSNSISNITLNSTTHMFKNKLLFQDADNANFTLTGVDDTYDAAGVELRTDTNPTAGEPLFTILSSGGAERLRVEHDGVVHTDNGLTVDGSTTLGDSTSDTTVVSGDLTVNGKLNGWPEGNYCIIQSTTGGCAAGASCALDGSNCPSGFTARQFGWDTDGNESISSDVGASGNATVNGANGVITYLCCK